MSDQADTLLYNQMKGTMFLIELARDWERVALDQSVSKPSRLWAAECARAIRQELRP